MLELRDVTKRFGDILANDRVNIAAKAGTIHAIVGENGAGKSTAMRIAFGFYRPDYGDVFVDGKPRKLNSSRDAIALGIGMVHQHFMLVDTMTVAENIVLGAEPGSAVFLDLAGAGRRIDALSKRFEFAIDPNAMIERLSVGEQQRVEIIKALYRDARVLILDEPTAVLTPPEIHRLFETVRRMRDEGRTVIIITHKLDEVLSISDEVTVMRDGRVVGHRRTSGTDPVDLARLMVGRDVLLQFEKTRGRPRDLALSVRQVCRKDRLWDISFDIHAGEIVGIAGVEGNGQTELVEVLAGLADAADVTGSIRFYGEEISHLSVAGRRKLGIAHIPEDRRRRGLLLDSSVADNAILGRHCDKPAVRRDGSVVLNVKAIRAYTQQLLEHFDVRPSDPYISAGALSGGNQQKLIVGREVQSRARLLLVAQPTRGVDIGAIELIYHKLMTLRDAGCAVLLISAELDEVIMLSDRVLVMYGGRIAAEVDPALTPKEEIGFIMTGTANRG